MASYPHHFPDKLEKSKYEYYRVSNENVEKFRVLQTAIKAGIRKKKAIPFETLQKYFLLIEHVETKESIHYVLDIINNTSVVKEYFEAKNKDYVFKEEYWSIKDKKEAEEYFGKEFPTEEWLTFPKYENFGFMINRVISRLLKIDRKEALVKDDCIAFAFEEFVNYRNTSMSKLQKKNYGKYKFAALSAFIARNVFELSISSKHKSTMTIRDYFQSARNALEKLELRKPEIFKGLPK